MSARSSTSVHHSRGNPVAGNNDEARKAMRGALDWLNKPVTTTSTITPGSMIAHKAIPANKQEAAAPTAAVKKVEKTPKKVQVNKASKPCTQTISKATENSVQAATIAAESPASMITVAMVAVVIEVRTDSQSKPALVVTTKTTLKQLHNNHSDDFIVVPTVDDIVDQCIALEDENNVEDEWSIIINGDME